MDKLKEKCGLHYLNCGLEVDINKKALQLQGFQYSYFIKRIADIKTYNLDKESLFIVDFK